MIWSNFTNIKPTLQRRWIWEDVEIDLYNASAFLQSRSDRGGDWPLSTIFAMHICILSIWSIRKIHKRSWVRNALRNYLGQCSILEHSWDTYILYNTVSCAKKTEVSSGNAREEYLILFFICFFLRASFLYLLLSTLGCLLYH